MFFLAIAKRGHFYIKIFSESFHFVSWCDFIYARRHKKNVHGIGEGVIQDTPASEADQEVDSKFFTHQQIEEDQRLSQQLQQQQTQTLQLQQVQPMLLQPHHQQQQQQQQQPPPSDSVSQSMDPSSVVKVQTEIDAGENVTIQYDEKGQKSYKCDVCDKVLQSKYNLKRHNVSFYPKKDSRFIPCLMTPRNLKIFPYV